MPEENGFGTKDFGQSSRARVNLWTSLSSFRVLGLTTNDLFAKRLFFVAELTCHSAVHAGDDLVRAEGECVPKRQDVIIII